MLENLIKDTKEKIAQFIDCDKVAVQVKNHLLEVKSGPFTMFCYNFRDGKVVEGQAHKVGFTPARLYDLRQRLQAANQGLMAA